ncbi:immunity 49 family protein [Aquincola sp. S2]|uniref:Immunity 49 family protein n=1 Tax=Pseudaquabacterium terrae TaxID=2732868 RepID=A0ABX2ELH3_9BURK|nr:Imm49 family immunity protein [Aquabacterium terrae]NRF69416.1 immunity 49 family protein [Aquabacterium terrae]
MAAPQDNWTARQRRVAHIKSHLADPSEIEQDVDYIRNNKGDPAACVLDLNSKALAQAMLAWFDSHDLAGLRQWCYVGAKLRLLRFKMKPDTFGPGGKFLELRLPLLSNHAGVIQQFIDADSMYDMKRAESHKTHDFCAYQAIVALRGEWTRLAERAERVLADPPAGHEHQKYLVEHRFYLALARGNVNGMEDALAEITAPKAVKSRSNDESGFTEDLISTAAVNLAKIAWRSGYPIKVDSPFVPAEWLPMDPLPHYDLHYDFLK